MNHEEQKSVLCILTRELTFRLDIDVFGVLLLSELEHAESTRIQVNVVQHVCVLVPAQPLVLPVEPDRF